MIQRAGLQHEVVAGLLTEEGAFRETSSGDVLGDVKVTRAAPIEVERIVDRESGNQQVLESLGHPPEARRVGISQTEMLRSVPDQKRPRSQVLSRKPGERFSSPDETGSTLQQLARLPIARPGGQTHGFPIENSRAQIGGGIEIAPSLASADDQAHGLAIRTEETPIDRGWCPSGCLPSTVKS